MILGAAAGLLAGLVCWIALFPQDWRNWLGFSKAAYFTNGQNYAFYSGIGPMLLTSIGMSTIIGGLWHAHNCHADGCWNIGRHRINGSPWCNTHMADAQAQQTLEVLLTELITLLKDSAQARTP